MIIKDKEKISQIEKLIADNINLFEILDIKYLFDLAERQKNFLYWKEYATHKIFRTKTIEKDYFIYFQMNNIPELFIEVGKDLGYTADIAAKIPMGKIFEMATPELKKVLIFSLDLFE